MRTESDGLLIVDVQRDSGLDRPGPSLVERHHVMVWMPNAQSSDAISLLVQCRDCIPVIDNGRAACEGMREVVAFIQDCHDPHAFVDLWPFENTVTVSRAASITLMIEGLLGDEETAEHQLTS